MPISVVVQSEAYNRRREKPTYVTIISEDHLDADTNLENSETYPISPITHCPQLNPSSIWNCYSTKVREICFI